MLGCVDRKLDVSVGFYLRKERRAVESHNGYKGISIYQHIFGKASLGNSFDAVELTGKSQPLLLSFCILSVLLIF